MTRFEPVVKFTYSKGEWIEMEVIEDGEWVRYKDVENLLQEEFMKGFKVATQSICLMDSINKDPFS